MEDEVNELDQKKYSVGQLTDPRPFDRCFESYEDACSHALDRAPGIVWAVFDNEDGEVVAICWERTLYVA